jgi:hypothetical protein
VRPPRTPRLLLTAALAACLVAGPALAADVLPDNTVASAQAAVARPVFTAHPASRTVTAGARTTFTAKASGSRVSYQWQTRVGTGAWRNAAGATASSWTLTTSSGLNGRQVRVVAKNAGGQAVSRTATLTVITPIRITAQPTSRTVVTGARTTFTVKATGTSPSYRWQTRTGTGAWTNVVGARSASWALTTGPAHDGLQVRAVVANKAGQVISSTARLRVQAPAKITAQPTSRTVAAGARTTFTVKASGSSLTYQWQTRAGSGAWENAAGATASSWTLVTSSRLDGRQVRVLVRNGVSQAVSSTAVLTVQTPVTITTQPTSRAVPTGATTTFTVRAAGTSPTYQWQYGSATSGWRNVAGATTPSWTRTTSAADHGMQVRVVVRNATSQVVSSPARLSVLTPVRITSNPASATVTAGARATFSVGASGSSLTYQWQTRAGSGAWTNVAGATAPSYTRTTGAQDDGLQVRAVVKNVVSQSTSGTATITIAAPVDPPEITREPNPEQVVTPGVAAHFGVSVTGTDLRYRWQTRMPGGTWKDVATTATYTVTPTDYGLDGMEVRGIISNSAGSVTTPVLLLIVEERLGGVTASPDQVATIGDPVTLTAKVRAGRHLRYEWTYRDEQTGRDVPVPTTDATRPTVSFIATEENVNRLYSVRVSNYLGSETPRSVLVYTDPFQGDGGAVSVGLGQTVTLAPTVVEVPWHAFRYRWDVALGEGEFFAGGSEGSATVDVRGDEIHPGEPRSYRLTAIWDGDHEIHSDTWTVTRTVEPGE